MNKMHHFALAFFACAIGPLAAQSAGDIGFPVKNAGAGSTTNWAAPGTPPRLFGVTPNGTIKTLTPDAHIVILDDGSVSITGFINGSSPTITTPTIVGAITWPDGTRQTFNPNGTNSGFNVGSQAGDPSSPSNGDIWYNSSANAMKAYINGAAVSLGAGGGGSGDVVGPASSTNNNVAFFDGTTGKLLKDMGVTLSGTNTGDQTTITGNAGTATALQTSRNINGTAFNGTADITITAAAATLTGTTLNSSIVTSSLTTVGTIGTGGWAASTIGVAYGGTGQTTAQAAINAFMAASGALSQGDIFYFNGTNVVRLAAGTSGHFLKTNGAGANPAWAAASGSGDALTTNSLAQFAATSSAEMRGVISDETGTGPAVFATSPTFTTPNIGAATASSVNGMNIAGTGAGLTIANNKILTCSNTLTFQGSDSITINFGSASGQVGMMGNPLSQFASTTSSQFRGVLSDETGTGVAVFGNSPTIGNPAIDKISNLTGNGFVKTSGGDGTLSVDTATYQTSRTGVVREIWLDAGAMSAQTTGGAAAATVESTTNDVMNDYWDFDQSTDEAVQVRITMPMAWNNGTVKVKVSWTASSGSGDAIWTISGLAASNDDPIDGSFGTAQSVTDTLTATGDVCWTSATSAITIGGSPAAGDVIWLKITRDADNGSDTLSADARLLGVHLQYTESSTEPSAW